MIEIEGLKAEISKMESYLNEHYFEDSEALQEIKNLISDYEM